MKKGELIRKTEYIFGALVIAAFVIMSVVMLIQMKRYDSELSDCPLEGSGSETDPYRISDAEDYVWFTHQFESYVYGKEYVTSWVKLTDDIVLTGEAKSRPIGNTELSIYFAGDFDGCGHSISGYALESDYAAPFPKLAGRVRNLVIKDSSFKGKNAAGITGELTLTGCVENCRSMAEVSGEEAAGICSFSAGTLENCLCTGKPVVNDTGKSDCLWEEGKADAGQLNSHIPSLPPVGSFNRWTGEGRDCSLSTDVYVTPLSVSIDVRMAGRPAALNAFFSEKTRHWMFILPESVKEASYEAEAVLSDGSTLKLSLSGENDSISLKDTVFEPEFCYYGDVPTVMVEFFGNDRLSYLYSSKDLYETAAVYVYDEKGNRDMSSSGVTFSGRGNDSYYAKKKGYSIELPVAQSMASMEKADGYNLIPGYRDNCFLTYMFTRDLYKGLDLDYAHEYRCVNLFINGGFQGLYFLTEKMAVSESSFDLENLKENTKRMNGRRLYEYPWIQEGGKDQKAKRVYFDIPATPDDVTGGYLLEVTMIDYDIRDSRFVTENGVIVSSKGDKNLSRPQLDYIQGFVQDYENAVHSPDGYNQKGIYYADYIDMESFADQWILFDTAADLAVDNSVYYYKDSDLRGDKKLHAVWYWDAEHMLCYDKYLEGPFLMRRADAGKDCSFNKPNSGNFWTWIYAHEDFRETVRREFNEKFAPAYERALSKEVLDNTGGVGSFNWYRTLYSDSFRINDNCWEDTDYLKKCDELEKNLGIRLESLREYYNKGND